MGTVETKNDDRTEYSRVDKYSPNQAAAFAAEIAAQQAAWERLHGRRELRVDRLKRAGKALGQIVPGFLGSSKKPQEPES